MFEFRHILCPTDFSPTADASLAVAASLAAKYGAKLTLLHVVESLEPLAAAHIETFYKGNLEAALAKDSEHRLSERIERVKQTGLEVGFIVRTGYAGREIVRTAEELSVDLIVMGTHGRSLLQRAFIGSVSHFVGHHAPCAFLMTPPTEEE